jgi:hypothetical protein
MIDRVTRSPRRLFVPCDVEPRETWVYQTAYPFQVSPTEAAVFVGIRRGKQNVVDLEVGSDVVVFDSLKAIDRIRAAEFVRGHEMPHPRHGQRIFVAKYPIGGGFVPLGAKRADGSPHPHAGTGFGLTNAIGFPVADKAKRAPEVKDRYDCMEVQQFFYHGKTFGVTASEVVEFTEIFPGWKINNRPLGTAIGDGDDLLFPAVGSVGDDPQGAVLTRWSRIGGAWKMAECLPISGPDGSFEPSLVRDVDGSLLASARDPVGSVHAHNASPNENSIRVWRSTDGGRSWEKVIHAADIRSATPVSINLAADGTPYVASSPNCKLDSFGRKPRHSILLREQLQLWPLSADRRSLGEPILIRDCNADFGKPPGGSVWYADHPVGCTVRLGDGKWHHLLGYRCLEQNENQGDQGPTDFTGCYVEEVISNGVPVATWLF